MSLRSSGWKFDSSWGHMKKNVSRLNRANIVSGKLKEAIPEFYELKDVIENNVWHNEESTFDHTLSVLRNLDKLFLRLNGNFRRALNQKVDKNSKRFLLRIATLFHDIGKKETIARDGTMTNFSNHEEIGAKKAKEILKRFDLSDEEINFISDIIKSHNEIHLLLGLDGRDFQKTLSLIKNKFKNIYPELVLLTFADTLTSYLRKTQPKNYRRRIDFLKRELGR